MPLTLCPLLLTVPFVEVERVRNRGQRSEINPPRSVRRRLQEFYLDAGATFVSMSGNLALQKIAPLIHEIRGERVILDSDLSAIYGVDTRSLMQAVKRNIERFPSDFAFQLSTAEYDSLRSQIVISKGRGV